MQQLCPTVSWGQRKNLILLKVHLKDSKDHEVNVTNGNIGFSAFGIGASGENTYKFDLNLFAPVTGSPSVTATPAGCQIVLTKSNPEEPWPRLTKEKIKHPWLRVDFDYLETEDADESEGADDEADSDFNMKQYQMKAPREVKKEMISSLGSNLRKMYLFSYNMFQWLLFCAIMFNLVITVVFEHMAEAFYVQIEFLFKLAHFVMWLEVVNAVLRLTKGGVIPSIMQVSGRTLFIFLIVPHEPRLQSSLVVLALFFVYSLVELIRYPYYMVQVFDKEWYPLTWIRYSIWILLYPVGMVLEAVVLYLFITHRAETLFEPQISSLAPFVTIPIFLLLAIADYTLLRHMSRQRIKKLGGGSSTLRTRRGPPRKPKTT